MFPQVSSYRLEFKSPLAPNPDGTEEATVNKAVDSTVGDTQILLNLLGGQKPLGNELSFLKSLLQFGYP